MKARRSLLNGEEICKGFIKFDLWERGKLRHICSVHFSERVIHKSFSVNALVPAVHPTFIRSNTANQKGRGTGDAICIMKADLAEHYRKHGREGYILLGDFQNYFGSIDHKQAKHVETRAFDDRALSGLGHHLIDVQDDGLGLGAEPNQTLAVAIPSPMDHFVQEMCGVEAYGRYMDDFYCIHEDKTYLQVVLALIQDRCARLGITLNEKKTGIVKLSHGFTFLKKKFSYGENGKIVVRPCRDSITRERRKLKKHAAMVARGEMTMEQVEQSYQSWRGGMSKLDAHKTVLNMDALFKSLFSDGPKNASGGGSPP